MRTEKVIVIGAGVAGLVAAIELAMRGFDVTVLERAASPGGKLREVDIGGMRLDAGPTVFTLRGIFEDLFERAGSSLDAHVTTRPADILARHAWSADERLDLHADLQRSCEAIGDFAGPDEARRFTAFADEARRIYRTLDNTFMRASRPGPLDLVRRAGIADLFGIRPFSTLWSALGGHFRDPRLRQLFGRYATYCGSSPYQAPATLMLVAHVEQSGVWLIDGGMHRLAVALATLGAQLGVRFRYGEHAAEILVKGSKVSGVLLASGEHLGADIVIANTDVAALAAGHLGPAVRHAVAAVPPAARSLSAVTWNRVTRTDGFPLLRHTVFFSGDYRAEFDDIFRHRRLPQAPSVYVCAQDRDDCALQPARGSERLLCLVNAPADGDRTPLFAGDIERCESSTFRLLERCGLRMTHGADTCITTTPADFERLYPATGGALYGEASHGWRASFRRPGSRSRIPGLYLAGGSTHPGPGIPMAALSGRLAADCVMADR